MSELTNRVGNRPKFMSSRRKVPLSSNIETCLRIELDSLKQHAEAVEVANKQAESKRDLVVEVPNFDNLNGVEQAAASLGINPADWKPIKFMNNAHYDSLVKNNALEDSLARRIEAFRSVSAS